MNLTIDGKTVTGQAGDTVLAVAERNGLSIPHLCTHSALEPFGACRMCLVEIEGMRGFPPSCTTPAAEGMIVNTKTPKLLQLRRNILGLAMLEHPNACLVCGKRELCEEFRATPEKSGRTTGCHTCNNMSHCAVRKISQEYGLTQVPLPPVYHERPLERSNPFIDRDLNLCILCGLCVRICKKHQDKSVIDFVKRGGRTHIGEAFGRSLTEAGCTFCGSCVDVCPTGTLSDRFAKWYGEADRSSATTCALCPEACALMAGAKEGKLVSVQGAQKELPVCAVGRFALEELLSDPARLRVSRIRVQKNLRECALDEAVASVAQSLSAFRGGAFALVCGPSSLQEERHVFRRFTKEVMQSPHYIELDADDACLQALPYGVRAVLVAGNLLDSALPDQLEYLVLLDCLQGPALQQAHAVFPSAVLTEVDGTMLDGDGIARPLHRISDAPGQAQPDWRLVSLLASAMGSTALDYPDAKAIAAELGLSPKLYVNRPSVPVPARDIQLLPRFFRGHRLAEFVPGLTSLGQKGACSHESPAPKATQGTFQILHKREVVPNTYELTIHAPNIAKKAQAGQFCIAMADEASERVPYTLCDWDAEAGTIQLVVLEKGQSSRKLVMMREGECLAHLVGPLGIPLEMKNYGRVALAGGCYGVSAIAPVARALRAAGNHVTLAVEARSHYLTFQSERLAEVCDEFIQTTIDGSQGMKGHAVDAVATKLNAGEHFDLVIAIGCPFMMMLVSKETKPRGIPTLAALNPIMLDGTGMCGACRVTVDGKVKFVCVDGPFLDAHHIDWNEVRDRRAAYSNEEIQSVGHSAPLTLIEKPLDPNCVAHQ